MDAIKVNKVTLRQKVAANREAHRAIFEEALSGYKAEAVRLLQEHLAAVRSGKIRKVVISLPVPEDHTKDYDRVLAMLDMSVDGEIELKETDFQAYVMDDWSWKRQFLTSNAPYSETATTMLAQSA